MPRTPTLSRLALAAAAAAVLAFPLVQHALAAHGEEHGEHEHGHAALDEAMNGLKDHLRQLATTIAGPTGDAETLAHLDAMQQITLGAKALAPANLEAQPADKRGAHQADYRRDMARLLRELADMEILVLDGKHAEAKERIKKGLVELRDSAHDKFQEQH
jgi:soluble cytochrome b562